MTFFVVGAYIWKRKTKKRKVELLFITSGILEEGKKKRKKNNGYINSDFWKQNNGAFADGNPTINGKN